MTTRKPKAPAKRVRRSLLDKLFDEIMASPEARKRFKARLRAREDDDDDDDDDDDADYDDDDDDD